MSSDRDTRGASTEYQSGMSADEYRAKYGTGVPAKLGSNENPFGPSPLAVGAISAAASEVNRYPPVTDEALRVAIAATLGHSLGPQNIVTGNGGADVLSLVARSELDADAECIVCVPTFPVYEMTARLQGASVVRVALDPGDFTVRARAILRHVSARTRLIYICSPNNPTGNLFDSDQLDLLLDQLPPDVLVVSDEVYHHFVSGGMEGSLARVGDGRSIIVIHSYSKAHGLAGVRLGYGVATEDVVRRIAAQRLPFHINSVTVAAGVAALRDGEYLAKTVAAVRDGRAWLFDRLRELTAFGVTVWPSEANFLLFKPDLPADRVAAGLLERGVIVRDLSGFSLPGSLRVTVGLPAENRRFIAALSEVLSDLRRE